MANLSDIVNKRVVDAEWDIFTSGLVLTFSDGTKLEIWPNIPGELSVELDKSPVSTPWE